MVLKDSESGALPRPCQDGKKEFQSSLLLCQDFVREVYKNGLSFQHCWQNTTNDTLNISNENRDHFHSFHFRPTSTGAPWPLPEL
jgi:hypothetical protein